MLSYPTLPENDPAPSAFSESYPLFLTESTGNRWEKYPIPRRIAELMGVAMHDIIYYQLNPNITGGNDFEISLYHPLR